MTDFHHARNRRPVYEAAHAKYGLQAQCSKAIEELAECTIELARMFTDRFDRNKLVEELADAICVLEQMALLLDDKMEADVADMLAAKVARLKGRVENEGGHGDAQEAGAGMAGESAGLREKRLRDGHAPHHGISPSA